MRGGGDLDLDIQPIFKACLEDMLKLEDAIASPLPESNIFSCLDTLRSSNQEPKKLADSVDPNKRYTSDFGLREKTM